MRPGSWCATEGRNRRRIGQQAVPEPAIYEVLAMGVKLSADRNRRGPDERSEIRGAARRLFPEISSLIRATDRRLRQNADLSRRINVIWAVQSQLKKYSALSRPQITSIFPPVPSLKRDASRSSRTLGAGCDGRLGDARRAAPWRTAKSCGPDAPTLASSWRKQVFAGDGGKKARSPGRARYKP